MNATQDAITQALTICDREPIHIPGCIQPHGFLLAFNSKKKVVQASANAGAALGLDPQRMYGHGLPEVLGSENGLLVAAIEAANLDAGPDYLDPLLIANGTCYQAIAHRHGGILIVEFERAPGKTRSPSSVFGLLRDFMSGISPARSGAELCDVAVREIRKLTGFDRVLIYRFDRNWNGTVIAEDRNGELPSLMDLRFPASDIPSQARELYRLNRLRMIVDSDYTPIPIEPTVHPETGRPLDLTYSVLRSVSPVHVQYMKNMGTGASLSVSMLRDGALWGLISCHTKLPLRVGFEVRISCDMIAQVLSSQLAARDHYADADGRISLKSTNSKLLGYMVDEEHFIDGLAAHSSDLIGCTGAAGVAIVFQGHCQLFGLTPTEDQIRGLVGWLHLQHPKEAVFVTDSLNLLYEGGQEFSEVASGVIAASISSLRESYIVWFRPEVQRTVCWGGDPRKPTEPGSMDRLNPRHSFEVWKELVRGFSNAWSEGEIDSATDLRLAIIRIVLRQAEELAELSGELKRSNEELEAFSYSVSHDLLAPFRHILGHAELLRERESSTLSKTGRRYVDTITESAVYAGKLVDNLLSFSQIGRTSLNVSEIDTQKLVAEVIKAAMVEQQGRRIDWRVDKLPHITGDLFMLRLVFQNLISNALKYSRRSNPAVIEISSSTTGKEVIFTIRDNGVGFDQQYAGKLFGVFQRLHRIEDFEGTGIGLANVKRIVSRHKGRAWAEGEVDKGAAFSFSLPEETAVTTT